MFSLVWLFILKISNLQKKNPHLNFLVFLKLFCHICPLLLLPCPPPPLSLFHFGGNVDSWQIPWVHIPTRLTSISSDVDLLHDQSTIITPMNHMIPQDQIHMYSDISNDPPMCPPPLTYSFKAHSGNTSEVPTFWHIMDLSDYFDALTYVSYELVVSSTGLYASISNTTPMAGAGIPLCLSLPVWSWRAWDEHTGSPGCGSLSAWSIPSFHEPSWSTCSEWYFREETGWAPSLSASEDLLRR